MGFTRDAGVRPDLEFGQAPQLLPESFGLRRSGRELDPLIQVLRVLPDDHEVHRSVSRRHARERPRGPHGGEQIQLLAKRDVDAPEPRPHGGGDRTLDGDSRSSDRIQRLGGKEVAQLGESDRTRLMLDPCDPGNRGIQDETSGRRHLRPDAVARDQRDTVPSHHRGTLPDADGRSVAVEEVELEPDPRAFIAGHEAPSVGDPAEQVRAPAARCRAPGRSEPAQHHARPGIGDLDPDRT